MHSIRYIQLDTLCWIQQINNTLPPSARRIYWTDCVTVLQWSVSDLLRCQRSLRMRAIPYDALTMPDRLAVFTTYSCSRPLAVWARNLWTALRSNFVYSIYNLVALERFWNATVLRFMAGGRWLSDYFARCDRCQLNESKSESQPIHLPNPG